MDKAGKDFLVASLGADGARALLKAVGREPQLAGVLLPRAILGWLNFTTEYDFEGEIPGQNNSYCQFQKTESGFSGSIALDDGVYSFENASIYHLAASLAVSLKVPTEDIDTGLRDTVLVKLGKSVDTLCKAQVLMQELHADPKALKEPLDKAVLDPKLGYQIHHEEAPEIAGSGPMLRIKAIAPNGQTVGHALYTHNGPHIQSATIGVDEDHQRLGIGSAMHAHAQKVTGKKLIPGKLQTDEGQALWAGNAQNPQFGKVELPGMTAKPQKQLGPIEPEAPRKQAAGAKTPRIPSLSIGKAEALNRCEICDGLQFDDNKFTGCICLRSLSKSITTTVYGDGICLDFGPGIDADGVRTLMRVFRRK